MPWAQRVEPADPVPPAWHDRVAFLPELRFRQTMLGDQHQIQMPINDDGGRFIGVLYLYRGTIRESLLQRLSRGDQRLFERMERVSEPRRRPAGILFADLEASGDLSRRVSSRGYFGLIRDLTDLIDSSVIAREGSSASTPGTADRHSSSPATSTARSPQPREQP